jgi:hypothetical protein
MSRVFSLSHHANYQCRHSGACCTAGWTIPVEPDRQARLGATELPQASGACQFYDQGTHLCAVHRGYGEAAMPTSCQHFPRRALVDDRGTFVTLSHFCPTATALLFESSSPMTIVENPPAFPAGYTWDGLDARKQWPPLINPGTMFDLDTYSAFEHFLVETLARQPSVDAALEAIAGAIERLREWNQRRGAFSAWAAESFALAKPAAVILPGAPAKLGALVMPKRSLKTVYEAVLRFVPTDHEPRPLHSAAEQAWREEVAPRWLDYAGPINRFVAAKGFGSWTAYQGRGVRTLLAEMTVSEIVLRAEAANLCARAGRTFDEQCLREAIAAADWLLVHLVDRQPFVDWLTEVEHR